MRHYVNKRARIGPGVLAAGLLAAGLLAADPRAGWVALPVLAGLVPVLQAMRGIGAIAPGGEQDAAAVGRTVPVGRGRSVIGA